jgi:hypothetical protein
MDSRDQMNVVLYEMRMMMKEHRENFKSSSKEERTRLRKLRKQYEKHVGMTLQEHREGEATHWLIDR